MEDSTLYNVCEVLFVKEKFSALEGENPDQFAFMTGFLNDQQKQQLMTLFGQAEQIKALELQKEQQEKQQKEEAKQRMAGQSNG